MTVSIDPNKKLRYKPTREYLFIFPDSESMISSILFLYRHKFNFNSMLYKTENDYRLIIKCKRFEACLLSLNEFCKRHSSNVIETAFTKEYGKLLISKNAIKTIGKYFFKETWGIAFSLPFYRRKDNFPQPKHLHLLLPLKVQFRHWYHHRFR